MKPHLKRGGKEKEKDGRNLNSFTYTDFSLSWTGDNQRFVELLIGRSILLLHSDTKNLVLVLQK